MELFSALLRVLDPAIFAWSFVVIALFNELKKLDLPDWFPPLPLVVWLASFIICFVLGLLKSQLVGLADTLYLELYALGNSFIVAGMAVGLFDTGRGFKQMYGGIKRWKSNRKKDS